MLRKYSPSFLKRTRCVENSFAAQPNDLSKYAPFSERATNIAPYWSTIKFDGHLVIPLPVSCNRRPGDKFKSLLFITDFIPSAIRDIKGSKHSETLALFQFTAEHTD